MGLEGSQRVQGSLVGVLEDLRGFGGLWLGFWGDLKGFEGPWSGVLGGLRRSRDPLMGFGVSGVLGVPW